MSRVINQTVLRSFFVLELGMLTFFYLFGAQGIPAVMQTMRENEALQHEITHLEQEIVALKQDISQWNASSFYKLKVAREALQMAYPGDQIYLVD